MPLSKNFFERRADRLFEEWDSIKDPYGLPTKEFQKAIRKIQEACIISMMLETMNYEIEKAKTAGCIP